ncbi:MAG: GNAT family N-acetyltransferase [Acholeplasmataceae bacterium]
MMSKIVELSIDEYKDYPLVYEYMTKFYYDISIKLKKDIHVRLKRKKLGKKQNRSFTEPLFQNFIEKPEAFGIFDRKKLVAAIEGSIETWNNRYRIWNIAVDKKYQRQGYGKLLFSHIIEVAKSHQARALVLECQSCNDPAISFYLKQGMHFIGFDTLAYSNHDVQNKEVRLEMGMRLD